MSETTITLLQTKLHRPRPSSDLILRPRLFEQLHDGLNRALTLVCAPAGFGKTTLVSSWIESINSGAGGGSNRWLVAWLSLDNSDSEVVLFTQYLIAALRTIFNDACPETLRLIQGAQLPPLKRLSTALSNEIAELPGRFILVLDDYYSIHGEMVVDLLNELLQHWPSPLHLVLISRNNPPLPLPRLRANGALTEIRSNDLRFDKYETNAFLSRVLQTPLSEPVVEILNERTEGWIAALRLVSLSLRTGSNVDDRIRSIAGSEENIADYLADEVLAQQFPAIQTFLLETSILDRFCAPLCEAVIGEGDPAWGVRACIDWLERRELFIVPLDNFQEWYRYHHVFRALLQQKLFTEMAPEKVDDLHRRASTWLERQGLIEEAFKHALLSNDLDLTARLMEQGLCDLLNREDRLTLQSWKRLLPEEFMQSRPWLLMIKAWTLHFSWELNALSKCLSQVEALIDEGGGSMLSSANIQLLRGQIAALRGQEAYFNNRLADAKAYCQDALRLVPPSWDYLRGGVMMYLGMSMQASGEVRAAERMLLDLYDPLEDKTDAYALRILQSLCFIYLNEGLLEKTRQIAEVMLQQATRSGKALIQAWARFFLGVVYYQWNELDAAERYFTGVTEQRFIAHLLTVQNGLYGLAFVHQARGESSKANQILELTGRSDIERIGSIEEATRSINARLMFLQGNLESAFRWADAYTAPLSDHPLLWLEEPHLTRARILLARNTPADVLTALRILDALYEIAERTHNLRYKIEIKAVRALALQAQGKSEESLAELWQAVELSTPGGFLRIFIDLGPQMQEMLVKLVRMGHSSETIHRILAAFPDRPIGGMAFKAQLQTNQHSSLGYPALDEPLTPREIQVLAQLQEPMSIKEIAVKLGVSYATAKRHSINIYGKLGVNSRWDAVAEAIDLGILPDR